KITEIPAFVYEMRQLRKLQLSKNHIKTLAPEIGNLTGIIHFNLSENQIETVPDSISNLIRLRVCDLSDNKIARLPEAFGNVPILYQLRVRNNPISALPAGFAKMPGTIDITGTKIRLEDLSPALKARISTEKPAVKPKVINK
ncbi:MAG: leucine rich repeat domain containing protein, partial [Verrucomicrobiaceae bacterium]|nr:leucine rich repeat domain containing protein [Verrucomicrobiaceae bacterium]